MGGWALSCLPSFPCGHEQHSPNERFENEYPCPLCHFGSGLCPAVCLRAGAIVMAIAATVGGYWARQLPALPPSAVRLIAIAVGFGMSAIFFARQFCEIGNAYAKLRQAGLTRS